MTPAEQVKEIIRLMAPEDAETQTDAVFLVLRYMDNHRTVKAALQKQIALLEARLEERSKEKHDVINEKLDSERRLRKEKDDEVDKVRKERRQKDREEGRDNG